MAAQWPEDHASNGRPDTNSVATDDTTELFLPDTFDYFDQPQRPVGDAVDAEIVEEPKASRIGSRRARMKSIVPEMSDRDAKGGIPDIEEWLHFFSDIVIRVGTDYYIDRAFRGIDEELLSDREIERIHLEDKERNRIARPFAEYANKLKFTRKHGRMIIASADSIDALLQLGMWFSRVNRIAAKYSQYRGTGAVRHRAGSRAAPIFIPAERQQYEETPADVSFGQSESPQPVAHEDGWRPDVGGAVYNPSMG